MQYDFPNSQSVVDSLDSGQITGKKTQEAIGANVPSPSTMLASNKISLAKFKPLNRQSNALNSLISRQELALEKLAKLGLKKGEAYDFAHLLNELESGLEENANVLKLKLRAKRLKKKNANVLKLKLHAKRLKKKNVNVLKLKLTLHAKKLRKKT